jgi:hypothetical protein
MTTTSKDVMVLGKIEHNDDRRIKKFHLFIINLLQCNCFEATIPSSHNIPCFSWNLVLPQGSITN